MKVVRKRGVRGSDPATSNEFPVTSKLKGRRLFPAPYRSAGLISSASPADDHPRCNRQYQCSRQQSKDTKTRNCDCIIVRLASVLKPQYDQSYLSRQKKANGAPQQDGTHQYEALSASCPVRIL